MIKTSSEALLIAFLPFLRHIKKNADFDGKKCNSRNTMEYESMIYRRFNE
jgi:hypothetical protein